LLGKGNWGKTNCASQEEKGDGVHLNQWGKAKPVVQGDGEMEGEGEIDGRGEGDWGNVCLFFKAKEILMVNLTPKQTYMTPRQTTFLCNTLSSPLTVRTIPEIFKKVSFYERQTMEIHCCRRKRRRECEMMV